METGIKEEEVFDVAVIGGGAAGMMAAISASRSGARVVILEKNKSLGKKLLLTGNGRCNLTHASHTVREFIEKIGRNGKFLFSSLSAFGPIETMGFFESLGLDLKTENDGRVFPRSDSSQSVLGALIGALKKNKVKIIFDQDVLGFEIKNSKIDCAKLKDKKIYAASFILSTGGKAYPATGSTGDAYLWLEHLGHKIIPPVPALAPMRTKESWVKDLKGISLKNIGISLIQNNRKVYDGSGELIFTHFGLSGPAIINASRYIGEYLEHGEVFLEIDLLPALCPTELEEKLKTDFENYKKINLKNYLSVYFPQKLALAIMDLAGIEKGRKIHSITKPERARLAGLIKNLKVTVDSLLDFNHAMVTGGGVDLREVDPKALRSKIIPNLYLAGEILDLDGPTGGYNLQIAWTTGHAAGSAASGEKASV